jgi:hypothetical protein
MLSKIVLSATIAATALAAVPAAAVAQPRHGYYGQGGPAYNYRGAQAQRYADRGYGNRYRGYDNGVYARQRYESARYGRYYGQRCHDDGTAGTIIGAIAGGLLGSSVAGRGDRTVGALIGGGAGALIGNAIASDDCRR